jgi:phasin family protein
MAIAIETFLNPAKFTEELTSKLKDYRLPSIEVDAVVASQRENVEALANASRAAFEGAQAVAKRQAEILQETMNQTAKSLGTLAEAGSPPEVAAKQAELSKEAFEKALGNIQASLQQFTTKRSAVRIEAPFWHGWPLSRTAVTTNCERTLVVARRGPEGVERPHCGTYNHPRRPDRLLGPSTASPHAVWKL